jgi:hypothetical protein
MFGFALGVSLAEIGLFKLDVPVRVDDVLEDERYVEHRFVLEEVIPILSKFSAFIIIFFGFGDVCILMYLI